MQAAVTRAVAVVMMVVVMVAVEMMEVEMVVVVVEMVAALLYHQVIKPIMACLNLLTPVHGQ
ncbi:MAG TPA: hypothetical protein PLR36_06705 [Ferruginibacter sp.]|nr:hypothetical protein [Ferruginibacter sp.]